jgi:hypothetical protein
VNLNRVAFMQRRKFIKLLGGSMLAWPLATGAEQSDRVRRVGILVAEALEGDPYYEAAFRTVGSPRHLNENVTVRYRAGISA